METGYGWASYSGCGVSAPVNVLSGVSTGHGSSSELDILTQQLREAALKTLV